MQRSAFIVATGAALLSSGRQVLAVGPGQGPYRVVTESTALGSIAIIDGLGNVLIGLTYTSSSHTELRYYSSYAPAGPIMSAAYCTRPNQTVYLSPSLSVTSGPSASAPSVVGRHPWGTVTYAATSANSNIAEAALSFRSNAGSWQQKAPDLWRDTHGNGGGKIVRRPQGNGYITCTISSLALLGTYGLTFTTGMTAIGEAGINPFADAGFWGALSAWGSAYAAWNATCF